MRFFITHVIILGAFIGGCRQHDAAPTTDADPARCTALQPTDSSPTSRTAFLHEVLEPSGTSRTPKFDDYHAGSYHIDKADLAQGLVELARACGLSFTGAVVVGPAGPLWAYHVVTFFREPGGQFRVNALVMPHARITDKATGVVPASVVDSLFHALASSSILSPGAVPQVARHDTTRGREFRYDALTLWLAGDSAVLNSGSLRDASDSVAVRRVFEGVNAILARLKVTYPAPDPRGR